jgi:hypothetical protein
MQNEKVIQTISLTVVISIIFIISYLFSLQDSDITIILLFFGIFLSIILASGFIKNSETKKK